MHVPFADWSCGSSFRPEPASFFLPPSSQMDPKGLGWSSATRNAIDRTGWSGTGDPRRLTFGLICCWLAFCSSRAPPCFSRRIASIFCPPPTRPSLAFSPVPNPDRPDRSVHAFDFKTLDPVFACLVFFTVLPLPLRPSCIRGEHLGLSVVDHTGRFTAWKLVYPHSILCRWLPVGSRSRTILSVVLLPSRLRPPWAIPNHQPLTSTRPDGGPTGCRSQRRAIMRQQAC